MRDRWAVAGLLVLLTSEPLLISRVGGLAAVVVTLTPLVAVSYWTLFVRGALSSRFRGDLVAFHAATSEQRAHWRVFLLFVAIFLASIARAAFTGTMDPVRVAFELAKWSSVIALLFTVAVRGAARGDPSAVLRPVAIAFGVHTTVNVLLFAAGVRNELLSTQLISAPEPALMLRLLGVEMTRTVLPLANGTGGVQVAAGLAIGFAAFRSGAMNRAAALVLVGATMICILITDSRGGLLGGFAGMAAAAAPSAVRGRLRWLTPTVLVLPILMILAIGALSDDGLVQSVSRAGESSVGPLSGRPIIWGTIFIALSRFQVQHLVGFGAFGQVASGVNSQYAFLFSTSYASPTTAGAHNTLLQLVLDTGYLGVALYLFLLWSVLSCLATESFRSGGRRPWAIVGTAAMVSLLVLGVTDATLTITNTSTLVLFFALNLHCLAFGGRDSAGPVREPATPDAAM